jgi:hypothetical protein
LPREEKRVPIGALAPYDRPNFILFEEYETTILAKNDLRNSERGPVL